MAQDNGYLAPRSRKGSGANGLKSIAREAPPGNAWRQPANAPAAGRSVRASQGARPDIRWGEPCRAKKFSLSVVAAPSVRAAARILREAYCIPCRELPVGHILVLFVRVLFKVGGLFPNMILETV